MELVKLRGRWWYRLVQVIFGFCLFLSLSMVLLLHWDKKPVRIVTTDSYIHCLSEYWGYDYELSVFPYLYESLESGNELPVEHDLYARNLCRFQQVADFILRQRANGVSDEAIFRDIQKAMSPSGVEQGNQLVERHGVKEFLKKVVISTGVTADNFRKNDVGDGPRTKYEWHEKTVIEGSYSKWLSGVFYWFLGIVVSFLIIRAFFLYVVVGRVDKPIIF
jgi:hypothetical protein